MYRFENTQLLWLLSALVVITLVFIIYYTKRRKKLQQISDARLLPIIIPGLSINKPLTRFVFASIALLLIILALANPQGGKSLEKEINSKGIDVFFVLDISNSMLAEDIKPSRLERAKQFIYSMLEKMGADRVGLILMAGESYIQLPLTTDHAAMRMFVQSATTDLIDPQGTNFNTAFQQAIDAAERLKSPQLALVVLSDGENFEDDPMPLVQQCSDKNIVISTVAMGSSEGAPIPVIMRGVQTGLKKDEAGNTIISKPNQELLKTIAEKTNGIYISPDDLASGSEKIVASFEKMQQLERDTHLYSDYESYYLWFVIPAFLLLLIEFITRERRMMWQDKFRLMIEKK